MVHEYVGLFFVGTRPFFTPESSLSRNMCLPSTFFFLMSTTPCRRPFVLAQFINFGSEISFCNANRLDLNFSHPFVLAVGSDLDQQKVLSSSHAGGSVRAAIPDILMPK